VLLGDEEPEDDLVLDDEPEDEPEDVLVPLLLLPPLPLPPLSELLLSEALPPLAAGALLDAEPRLSVR
jgi:hypothetical protein